MRHPELVYASPRRFSLVQRLTLSLNAYGLAGVMKTLLSTCKEEVRNVEAHDQSVIRFDHALVAVWHETLALALWHFRNKDCHTLTSYSYDGELAARVVRRFDVHALRGSSSQGGTEALRQMQKAMGIVKLLALTVDGPKGPRRVAKPGVAVVAARAQVPILPVAFLAIPAWRMRSWDRLIIPKPFSRIIAVYGDPILPLEGRPSDTIRQMHGQVQERLLALQHSLETEFAVGSPC